MPSFPFEAIRSESQNNVVIKVWKKKTTSKPRSEKTVSMVFVFNVSRFPTRWSTQIASSQNQNLLLYMQISRRVESLNIVWSFISLFLSLFRSTRDRVMDCVWGREERDIRYLNNPERNLENNTATFGAREKSGASVNEWRSLDRENRATEDCRVRHREEGLQNVNHTEY